MPAVQPLGRVANRVGWVVQVDVPADEVTKALAGIAEGVVEQLLAQRRAVWRRLDEGRELVGFLAAAGHYRPIEARLPAVGCTCRVTADSVHAAGVRPSVSHRWSSAASTWRKAAST